MSEQQNQLRVEGLRKLYGKKTAVADVSFSMHAGEVVGLLGPNGAGKTTVFYMIVGFIRASQGSIFLDEENISHMPMYQRARRGISYLSQEPSIFRKLSVEKNIWGSSRPEQTSAGNRNSPILRSCSPVSGSMPFADSRPTPSQGVSAEERRSHGTWRSAPSSSCLMSPLPV